LFILLVALVIYAAVEGDFAKGAWFLFHFDFSKITPAVVLAAMGQAFFSASVGLGTMMTYGAYLPRNVHIPRAAGTIVAADTLVSILAGLAIFPIVFANGLDAGSGPGLVFVTLPLAFGAMPGGMLFGALFFILIVFAALTSSISLLEPVTSYAEERGGIPRRVLAVVIGIVIWALGLFTVFSFNLWADVHPLGMIERFRQATFFDLIDYATSNIFLPLGGFFIAIFAAWILDRATSQGELDLDDRWYGVWRFIARYVSPVAVAAIFIYNLS
jgi:NSS family neurotransmitter:Na+ symporter